jgi:hypothetical protein
MASNADIVKRGWAAVAQGDWDTLVADYTEDTIFVMPGQDDVLKGKSAFRDALENIGAALPPGFEISAIREIGESEEVVSIVDWKSGGSWIPSSGKPPSEQHARGQSPSSCDAQRHTAWGCSGAKKQRA